MFHCFLFTCFNLPWPWHCHPRSPCSIPWSKARHTLHPGEAAQRAGCQWPAATHLIWCIMIPSSYPIFHYPPHRLLHHRNRLLRRWTWHQNAGLLAAPKYLSLQSLPHEGTMTQAWSINTQNKRNGVQFGIRFGACSSFLALFRPFYWRGRLRRKPKLLMIMAASVLEPWEPLVIFEDKWAVVKWVFLEIQIMNLPSQATSHNSRPWGLRSFQSQLTLSLLLEWFLKQKNWHYRMRIETKELQGFLSPKLAFMDTYIDTYS